MSAQSDRYMLRGLRFFGGVVLCLGMLSGLASAEDAGPPFAPVGSQQQLSPAPAVAPAPTALRYDVEDSRPARGPALRERPSRRSRGGSAASGALFVVMLIGVVGYQVVKKLRR
jgi:hypothetical protein